MFITRQSARLVVNQINVYRYGFLFKLHDGESGLGLKDGPFEGFNRLLGA